MSNTKATLLEWRFFLVYAALFIPYSLVTPYMQQLLHLYGYRPDQIGYILGMLELMAVVAPPIWGIFSDRIKAPRATLIVVILSSALTMFLLRPGQSTFVALIAALIFGFCLKPSIPLTDGITFAQFAHTGANYGHVRIGGTVAFIFNVFVMERLLHIGEDTTGHLILAVLCASFMIEALSVALIPKMNAVPSVRKTFEPFPWRTMLAPGFLFFITAAFLARFAMMGYYSFFSRYLNEVVGCETVGYIWLIGPISEFPVIFWSGAIIRRIGIKRLFVLAMVGTVLRLFGFAFGSTLPVVIILQPLHALTLGAFHVSSVSWIGEQFPSKYQGTAQTVFFALTTGLGGVLGSAVAGVVLQHHGYTAMYMACGTVATVAFVLSLFCKRNTNN